MLYPQNGDRIVAIDSVTSRHPVYRQMKHGSECDMQIWRTRGWKCRTRAAQLDCYISTLGSWYFNVTLTTVHHLYNDECHVTAFRPISEAAHSWSYEIRCAIVTNDIWLVKQKYRLSERRTEIYDGCRLGFPRGNTHAIVALTTRKFFPHAFFFSIDRRIDTGSGQTDRHRQTDRQQNDALNLVHSTRTVYSHLTFILIWTALQCVRSSVNVCIGIRVEN